MSSQRSSMLGARSRVMGTALPAALASSVLAAGSAAAAGNTLDLTWNGEANQLAPGEAFDSVLYDPTLGRASPFTVETRAGSITCTPSESSFSGLEGVDATNNAKTDRVQFNSAVGVLAGERPCTSSLAMGTEAKVFVNVVNAQLYLGAATGKVQLFSVGREPELRVSLFYPMAYCRYDAFAFKGALKLEPWSGGLHQISISFTKQKLRREGGSAPECPKRAAVSATFGLQNHGEGGFGVGEDIFGHLR
jgi:hypothetical protein